MVLTHTLISGEIPRLDCLGLIEAWGSEINSAQELQIPRLDCLGLIEASRRASPGPLGMATEIPRLDCLGLIEAARTALRPFIQRTCYQRFRGLIASASLKHVKAGLYNWCMAIHLKIPRLDCLGLIEAW